MEAEAALQFVKNNLDPLDELKYYWYRCYKGREECLNSHNIFDYFKDFPVLRTQIGYQLLIQDYDRIYPNQKQSLYKIWNYLSRAIIKIGIKRNELSQDLLLNPNGNCDNLVFYFYFIL